MFSASAAAYHYGTNHAREHKFRNNQVILVALASTRKIDQKPYNVPVRYKRLYD